MHILMMMMRTISKHGLAVTRRDVRGGTIIGVLVFQTCLLPIRNLYALFVKLKSKTGSSYTLHILWHITITLCFIYSPQHTIDNHFHYCFSPLYPLAYSSTSFFDIPINKRISESKSGGLKTYKAAVSAYNGVLFRT